MSAVGGTSGAENATQDQAIDPCKKLEDKKKWDRLVGAVRNGECVPVLGPDFGHGFVPSKSQLAQEMLDENHEEWPLKDAPALHHVAEFLGVKYHDRTFPRTFVERKFKDLQLPHGETPHHFLAQLPLPIYITTYYDDLMCKALAAHQFRDPVQEHMRWNAELLRQKTVFESGYQPNKEVPGRPLVFYMHGRASVPQSLVLTQRDYLEFLANVSKNEKLIPPKIDDAIRWYYLLFLGYSFFDFDFIILLKSLADEIENTVLGKGNPHVAVQLADVRCPQDQERAERFLTDYFDTMNISVYPGTCSEFVSALNAKLHS